MEVRESVGSGLRVRNLRTSARPDCRFDLSSQGPVGIDVIAANNHVKACLPASNRSVEV
jgi:hypothetical protein